METISNASIRFKEKRKVNNKTGEVWDLALEVNKVLKAYPELHIAYQLFEDFHNKTSKLLLWKEAETLVDLIEQRVRVNNMDEFKSISKAFKNWRFEIINTLSASCFSIRLSNAVAEANNNNIQTLIDSAYEMLDFERLRKRILYINSQTKTREH